ncbi:restriction endonuclease subunit S [Cohnella panacarvi]|uniref:restriction endonuclease subunit S n=1 Tax=Cohnella panacarvi TaxID=400776 RepID=UPI00047CC435|nr:restriction endonuclease subunit S [Cohnella panacarvi]
MFIDELKATMLALAMQGKLVQQNLMNETISSFYKSDESKLDLNLSANASEIPFELPNGWQWVRVPEFLFFQEGPGVRSYQYTDTGVKLLNVANLQKGKLDLTTSYRYISEEEACGRYNHFLVDEGDLIIASSGITVETFEKKMGFAEKEHLPLCMNTSTIRFKSLNPKELDIRFFMYFLKSEIFKKQLSELITGSAQLNFGPSHLQKVIFPLPSYEEQQQIIFKIDEMFALIKDLEEIKNDTHDLVNKMRKKVLQDAVEGKLVPQDPNDEPANVLFERIMEEKERLIKEKIINKEKPLPPIQEHEIPYTLPQGWTWVRLGEVAYHSLGKMLDNQKNKGNLHNYLRNYNVKWSYFELDDVLQMKFEDNEFEKYSVIKGDLIICEGGYPGRAAVWEQDYSIFFQKALHRVRFLSTYTNYFFLNYLLLSDMNGELEKHYTGSGIQHLTGKSLNKITFPLPPLNEQKRIVEKVNQFMALCDEMEKSVI